MNKMQTTRRRQIVRSVTIMGLSVSPMPQQAPEKASAMA